MVAGTLIGSAGCRRSGPEASPASGAPTDPSHQALLTRFANAPEGLRGRIDAEGTIHFEPGGDTEGFSAHVWIMPDAGEPRLAHFYVGD